MSGEAYFYLKSALSSLHIHNEIMRDRSDARLCFCQPPSESIHHFGLFYFIVCLNTSPHGKLGVETSMENMTGSQRRLFSKEKRKKNTYFKRCFKACSGRFFIFIPQSLKHILENNVFSIKVSKGVLLKEMLLETFYTSCPVSPATRPHQSESSLKNRKESNHCKSFKAAALVTRTSL